LWEDFSHPIESAQAYIDSLRGRTEQVSERLPDLVSIIGPDYRYRRANPTCERVWRVPAEKIIGMHVGDIVGRETFDRVVKPIWIDASPEKRSASQNGSIIPGGANTGL
jgi:PAS domain-containing protein